MLQYRDQSPQDVTLKQLKQDCVAYPPLGFLVASATHRTVIDKVLIVSCKAI